MKEKTNAARALVPVKPSLRTMSGTAAAKRVFAVLLCFAFAFFVAGAEAFPGTYPFGIAAVSAAAGVSALIPVLAGGLLGSVRIPAAGGVHALLLTLLTVVRMFLSVWLTADSGARKTPPNGKMRPRDALRRALLFAGNADGTMLRESICVRMALSACTALFAGAWSVVRGGFSYYDLFGAVFSLLFTPLVTWLMYAAADRKMRASPFREAGIYAAGALLTHSLQTLIHTGRLTGAEGGILNTPFGFGILFAFAAAAVTAERYGIHRGAMMGICCGMVIDLRFLPMFAAAAMLCGILGRYSPTFGLLSAGVFSVAWAIGQAGFDGISAVLPPVTAACAVLIPLYRHGMVRLPEAGRVFGGAVRGISAEAGLALRSRGEMGRRLSEMSESMTSVSAILTGMSERLARPGKEEMREICESAFGMYCRGCALRSKCHGARASKTEPVIGAMVKELVRDGAVSAAAVPNHLASYCFHIGRILDEINRNAGERIARRKEGDRLAVTASDFGLAGELFRAAYDEGEAVMRIDGDLSKKLRRLLNAQDFHAGTVTAYGGRRKEIVVHGIDLASTRLGGDDIRRMFEKAAGTRLSSPEFSLDGAVLSMTMHAVPAFACRSGQAVCAASEGSRIRSEGDGRDEEAFCRERYAGIMKEAGDAGDGAGMEACGEAYEGYEGYEEYEMEEEVQVDVTDEPPSGQGEVCGDVITSFEAEGKYYMVISDGMGSGREAALTAGVCAAILQRLIGSGAGLDTSLKMLNNIIRAGERECSATMDIAEIDLLTGQARFIKSGAAPSFVLRDGSIFRLQSKTVPIGILRALDAEMIKFDILPGDRVVMVSDGAARSYEEVPWLLDMMTSDEVILKGSPKEAAAKIVREAARRGSADDITAGVISIMSA